MSPDRWHLCIPLGMSLSLTATFDAVAAGVPEPPPIGPHAPATSSTAIAVRDARMPPTVRDGIRGQSSLSDVGRTWDGNVATCRRPRYAPRLAGRRLRIHRLASAGSAPPPEHGT